MPAYYADAECAQGTGAIVGALDSIVLYGQPRWSKRDTVLGVRRGALPGTRDSIAFVDPLWLGTLWTKTFHHGEISCPSEYVGINGTTGVPGGIETASPQLYDITGRKIGHATAPGIYFERRGGRTRRVVVVR